jgi:hypothetical protein
VVQACRFPGVHTHTPRCVHVRMPRSATLHIHGRARLSQWRNVRTTASGASRRESPPKSLAYLPETAPTRMTLSEKRRDPLGTAITLKPREATARQPELRSDSRLSPPPCQHPLPKWRAGHRSAISKLYRAIGAHGRNRTAPTARICGEKLPRIDGQAEMLCRVPTIFIGAAIAFSSATAIHELRCTNCHAGNERPCRRERLR